jgi:hypothetical protein
LEPTPNVHIAAKANQIVVWEVVFLRVAAPALHQLARATGALRLAKEARVVGENVEGDRFVNVRRNEKTPERAFC